MQTGEHVDVPFLAAVYQPRFVAILEMLMDFDKKTKDANIVPRFCKHLLKNARTVILLCLVSYDLTCLYL